MAKVVIFTGQISKAIHYEAAGYTPVCILKSIPKKYRNDIQEEIPELGQSWAAKDKTQGVQSQIYQRILDKLNPRKIIQQCQQIQEDNLSKGIVLLSYEKPKEFSHRHLAAIWIKKYTGIKVKEYQLEINIKINDNLLTDD